MLSINMNSKMENKYRQNICKICFKNLNVSNSFSSFLSCKRVICDKCQKKFKDIDKHMKINGVDVWFLYEYDNNYRSLLYNYKGCYDIELSDVFLHKYVNSIRKLYKGYTIIYPPSSNEDNTSRGFIHMYEMVKCLKLPIEDMFYKTRKYNQSDHAFAMRRFIKDYIRLKPNVKIENKKYLIIDDVFTSGSTIKTIIKILIDNGVSINNIKCIIVSKTNIVL